MEQKIFPADRTRQIRRVLIIILLLNWGVAIAKAVFGLLGNSLSMVADAAHSTFDGGSNIVGLIAVSAAAVAADRDHPYGRQKFEVVGAALIGMFLATVAWHIGESAINRFGSDAVPEATPMMFTVLAVTLVVNILVTVYESRMGKKLASRILIADALHTRSDVLATCAVIGSLVATRLGYPGADPIIALSIAAYVAFIAVRLILSSSRILADRAVLDPADLEKVAKAVEGVEDCHEIRTRGSEEAIFADLRIHVDPGMPLHKAHDISHAVEDALKAKFKGIVDVVVHVEPGGVHHD